MSDVLTRAFAHARRRNESVETPLTPANEMTSWLSDDQCANCGSAVQGSKLYCSEQCRAEDSQHQQRQEDSMAAAASATSFASTAGTSSPGVSDRPSATAPSFSRSAPRLTQRRSPVEPPSTQAEAKFRYPCPPSPHLLAKYKASALTSPALNALERSLPSRHEAGGPEGTSISASSSDESSSRGGRMQGKRRSSSRSTFSSASTDNFSTVPSTPSPASRAAASSALIDDLDDLEPSDLCLPPSIKPASAVLLKSASRDASHSTTDSSSAAGGAAAPAAAAPASTRRSPMTKAATAPSPPPSTSASSTATMRYTRRPSTTNLPPPVLFTSPALTATHRINARGAPVSTSTSTAQQQQPQAPATRKALLPDEVRGTKRPGVAAGTFSSPAVLADSVSGSSRTVSPPGVTAVAVAALPMTSQRVRGSKSPEQIASAASSAGKTLRAFSPSSADNNEAMCGRPGCRGAASSRESLVSPGPSSWGASYPSSPRSSGLDAAVEGNTSRRPSMTRGRGHQHTHSARGGLSLRTIAPGAGSAHAAATVLAKGLVMTPAILPADAPSRRRSSAAPLASSPPALQIEQDEDGRGRSGRASTASPSRRRAPSPGRGRSKARGHSSTSRRSPSPPRAAARRGLSEDVSLRSLSRANSTRASTVLSPINAIEVPLPPSIGESPEAAADAPGASLKRNLRRDTGPSPMALRSELEREQERDREASRRGRSPTERGRGRDRGRNSNASSSAADEFGRIERGAEHSPSRPENVDVNSWAQATSDATWPAPAIAAAAAATASAVLSAKLVPAMNQATPPTLTAAKGAGMDDTLGYDEVELELDD